MAYRSLGMTGLELAHRLGARARRGKQERRSVSPAVVVFSFSSSFSSLSGAAYSSSPSCSAGTAVSVPKSPPISLLIPAVKKQEL